MNKKYKTKKQVIKARNETIAKYQKKSTTTFNIRFHNENDREVIEQLQSVDNKTDYIRQLILNDLKK